MAVKTVKKTKLTKEQKIENKKRSEFRKQIKNIFTFSGFKSLRVGRNFYLGGKPNELDHCFIYENIIIICEDTLKSLKEKEKNIINGKPYKDNHKLKKDETSRIIMENTKSFIEELVKDNSDCEELDIYKYNEFRIYYFYFEYGLKKVSNEDITRYKNLIFIDSSTMNYFVTMSKSIKASFKYEIFRFLNLKRNDIGKPDPCGSNNIKSIKTSIIYPDSVTGFENGIRMVSFMMRPSDLLENSCVLRKDGWDKKVDLYQRLIEPKKIKSIREFVVTNKTTFLNNIIVTLPYGIKFYKNTQEGKNELKLDEITKYSSNIEMHIPADFNSMAIIDGQHRVFAYYEDYDQSNINEKKIKRLRNELNLLVTGIIYPQKTIYDDDLEKRKFESGLFVSINENAKRVDADTLIQVQSIMNPTSGEAISRKVIQILNEDEPFKDMFQLSKVEEAPIKTASIIQYALSSLLVARNNSSSLYKYWLIETKRDETFQLRSSTDIEEYIKYCAKNLKIYFTTIKSRFFHCWNKDSKLLKVISLNAFIIAYRETLSITNGPKDSDFYTKFLQKLSIDFNETPDKPFKYAGAQYSKFAKNELIPLIKEVNTELNDQ